MKLTTYIRIDVNNDWYIKRIMAEQQTVTTNLQRYDNKYNK